MKPWDGIFQKYRYKAPEGGLLVDAGGNRVFRRYGIELMKEEKQ